MMATDALRTLKVSNHDRNSAGLKYVYPVVSRRAGGISVGINFNPNNACNWRCVYCQVPGLIRGSAPDLEQTRLQSELRLLLEEILTGEFHQRFDVPPAFRSLRDIAISGNGEPTTLKDFDAAIHSIETTLADLPLPGTLSKVIISNGSMVERPSVQAGLQRWGRMGGELWFKLDRATPQGLQQINGTAISPRRLLDNLAIAADRCPLRIQTCLFSLDGMPPPADEIRAYLELLEQALAKQIPIRDVMLYGLARPSMQAEAGRLGGVPSGWMEKLAARIRSLGLTVKVTP